MTHAALKDLLPCPFCAAKPTLADIRADESQGTKWGGVICPGCGVAGPEVRTGYEPVACWAEDAAEAWNTRAALSAMEGEAVLFGWVAPSTGQYFKPTEVAATDRSRELIAQGELVRVYTAPPPQQADGEVVVTTDDAGRCVMVSRQDDEHRILSIIWEVSATPPAHQPGEVVTDAMVERMAKWLCRQEIGESATLDVVLWRMTKWERYVGEARAGLTAALAPKEAGHG